MKKERRIKMADGRVASHCSIPIHFTNACYCAAAFITVTVQQQQLSVIKLGQRLPNSHS